jgi:hypothetical protein
MRFFEKITWIPNNTLGMKVGGWPDDVLSVTDEPFSKDTVLPRAMTLQDIADLKSAWAAAVKRALKVGVDVSSMIIYLLSRAMFSPGLAVHFCRERAFLISHRPSRFTPRMVISSTVSCLLLRTPAQMLTVGRPSRIAFVSSSRS